MNKMFFTSMAWIFGVITIIMIAAKITAWKQDLKNVHPLINARDKVNAAYTQSITPYVIVNIVCWCWIVFG